MSLLIDVISIFSIVGIWPRYVAPRLLQLTYQDWILPKAYAHLDGLKVAHLSDLHFHEKVSPKFLDNIAREVARHRPHLVLFTGDFICYSQLQGRERLQAFLQRLEAPLGAFCTFGNHDYATYVSRNHLGLYDVMRPITPSQGLLRGVMTLLCQPRVTNIITEEARSVSLNVDLIDLLRDTPFTYLENTTTTLPLGLNVTGLGDLSCGKFRPETAFSGFKKGLPGFVLTHNPDTFPLLKDYPGDFVFAGHTHGGQIYLPYPRKLRQISTKLARLENPTYLRGRHCAHSKELYVSRGMGGHKPFRLNSRPELMLLTARKT